VVLGLLAVACCVPLMQEGWFGNHEEIRPVARALAAYYEVARGDLYPRWLSTGYLGKGIPLLNFYPPAFSLLVAWLHAAGVPMFLAAKLVIFALFFLGAWGFFLWTRKYLGDFGGLGAAVLYLFAPYHFVDVYVRGATAEFTSLAALPWVFHGIDLALERLSARALGVLAAGAGAVVVSHFLSALMIAPFAVAYTLARLATSQGRLAAALRVAGGTLIGAALSAFFWLPALVERAALSAERSRNVVRGYNSYLIHFVEPWQWFDTSWGFGDSLPPGYTDQMSFQIGIVLVATVGLCVLLVWRLARPVRRFVLLALALGLAAVWLTSEWSKVWYAALEPYALVQFPWRFLGPASLFLAAAGGGLFAALPARWRHAAPVAVALTAALSLALSSDQRAIRDVMPIPDERVAIEAAVAADPWAAKFGNEDEFLPKAADRRVANSMPGGPFPQGLGIEIFNVREEGRDLVFDVVAPGAHGVVVVPWHDFPGWRVSLDGKEWNHITGPEGLITFSVPAGRHAVLVHFGSTPPRRLGWALTGVALVGLGGLALRDVHRRRRVAVAATGTPPVE
jgi:hypothetical protein